MYKAVYTKTIEVCQIEWPPVSSWSFDNKLRFEALSLAIYRDRLSEMTAKTKAANTVLREKQLSSLTGIRKAVV